MKRFQTFLGGMSGGAFAMFALFLLTALVPSVSSSTLASLAQLPQIATDRLLGRDTPGTGDVESLTVGGGLEFTGSGGIQRSALTGDVTASAGSSVQTVAANAVALGTDTTGFYAAGDAEAGAATDVACSGCVGAADIAAGATSVITFDTYANAPGSPNNGDVHFSTNSPIIRHRYAGAWVDELPPFGVLTVPTVAGVTALNSAVLSDVGGLEIRETTLSGTDRMRGAYVTTIAAPYSICSVFDGPGVRENYMSVGMFISDGTKLLTLSYANTCPSYSPCIEADRMNSVTSFASTIFFAAFANGGGARTELCISDDGTNRKYWASFDGVNFTLLHTILDTDWITTAAATRTGMEINSVNATWLGYGRFYSFRQTSGATPAFP